MGLKRLVKVGVALVWYAGARLARPFVGRRLTILFYHAVRPAVAGRFERQIRSLARRAELVTPDHVSDRLGGKPLVAVTFDDAFRSVRDHALSLLRELNVPTTIFVPTGHLGHKPGWEMDYCPDADEEVMSGPELAAIANEPVRIGSHSVDHPYMSRLGNDELEHQLSGSRATLETLLERPVELFAFPYGDCDERVVAQARQAGYRQTYGIMPEAIDPRSRGFVRGRVEVDPEDGSLEFFLKSSGAYAWMPYASRLKRALKALLSPRVRPAADVPV